MTLSKACQESSEWPSHNQSREKRLCGLIVLQVLVHVIVSSITTHHGVSAWWKKKHSSDSQRAMKRERSEQGPKYTLKA